MSLDRLLKYMDSMMNDLESMEMQMFGNILRIYLIIYH